MISLAIITVFLSFYVFYHTSKKVKIQSVFGFENQIQKKLSFSKCLASIFLIIALVVFIKNFGIGCGTLFFFIALMTIGSLVILLQPLNLINYKTLVLIIVVLLSFEFLTF